MIFGLGACGKQKYKLNFDGYGFESGKTSYEAGEDVTVYYDLIATDTDYSFYCDDDVDVKQTFDNGHGFVFTFTMPDHDVTMGVKSRNSMEYDPGANLPEPPEDLESEINPENMLIDYYEATVATVGGNERDEFVLYDRDAEAGLILARYSKAEDEDETMLCCLVPEQTETDCQAVIRSYKMEKWKGGLSLNGKEYVLKFKDSKGKMVRVSSEEMPEDGQEAFDAVGRTLATAWGQYYTNNKKSDDLSEKKDDRQILDDYLADKDAQYSDEEKTQIVTAYKNLLETQGEAYVDEFMTEDDQNLITLMGMSVNVYVFRDFKNYGYLNADDSFMDVTGFDKIAGFDVDAKTGEDGLADVAHVDIEIDGTVYTTADLTDEMASFLDRFQAANEKEKTTTIYSVDTVDVDEKTRLYITYMDVQYDDSYNVTALRVSGHLAIRN